MAHHEVLAERLAGLEPGAGGQGAVRRDTSGLEGVDHAGREGNLRADDHEIRGGPADELEDGGGVGGVDVEALGLERHPAVAGGDPDPGDAGAAEAGLEQRVLTAAGAKDENVEPILRCHASVLRETRRMGTKNRAGSS